MPGNRPLPVPAVFIKPLPWSLFSHINKIMSKQPIDLKGKLLLAMPDMTDPRFSKAVVFICAHDKEGAMGIVVNHIVDAFEGKDLLDQLNIESDMVFDFDVCNGGPVETSRGFLLHSNDYTQSDTVPIVEGISVTGTVEALKVAVSGEGPRHILFALGYAGWSAGQLDMELQHNAWLVADIDAQLIFELPKDQMWDTILTQMGINPSMLIGSGGRA